MALAGDDAEPELDGAALIMAVLVDRLGGQVEISLDDTADLIVRGVTLVTMREGETLRLATRPATTWDWRVS